MIDPAQSRMARAALGWSVRDLAKRAGIGFNTVNRFEIGGNVQTASVASMEEAFRAVGVEFGIEGQIRVPPHVSAREFPKRARAALSEPAQASAA
jgi:transcriptional regulator with XRE-family HTH domain